ncbi:MAG: virulence-associated protein E [Ruminococcus sp.]|nr:virulence-associated protein E [Ruminococcus sp.]
MDDRQITIAVGTNRKSIAWHNQQLTIPALYQRLSQPIVSMETHAEYINMPKSQQDALKDIGGFVGGTLKDNRRKAANVTGRDIVTLDFDNIPGWQADNITARVEALGFSYCIYSTRKHIPSKPRLRIIIPLDRAVTADEYEPIARKLAERIGIAMADKTTFDVSRLMYWPSCCSDAEFYYKVDSESSLAKADTILNSYADWHDHTQWPQVPGAVSYQKLAVKQGDPLEKGGTVGAFCRTYTIEQAMEKFLPGIYEAVDNATDRYTYLGGSTTGGAIIYDGKFLYSHHATDPCSERLVNAFDLVRLHKFADLDDGVKDCTPTVKLPSYLKMCDFAEQDKWCRATLNREQAEQIKADFANVASDTDFSTDWIEKLERDKNGIKKTIDNFLLILNNDPTLKGKFAYNEFACRGEVLAPLTWNNSEMRRMWTDADSSGLYWHLEKFYGLKDRGSIDNALSMYMLQHSFNEVQDFINSLVWDNVKRLDTLFIDYLGAEDIPYTRTVTRKMFVAAIARAMIPGTKFDNMLILVGEQGIGKSTILRKMAKGWFNDSISSFEGKEAAELLQGMWIVEIGELGAFNKSDTKRIKQFLSLNSDIYRAAYARNAEERKRRCVFFGTTNDKEFLRDPTGERRYWPVDCEESRAKKSVWNDLDEYTINQIWAEARAYWIAGELLNLSKEIEDAARTAQQKHKEHDTRIGMIEEFVNKPIPADWSEWSLDKRKIYWNSINTATQIGTENVKLVQRDRICALEVWTECLGRDQNSIRQTDTRAINAMLDTILTDWEHVETIRFPIYGRQRGYKRL